MSIELGPERRDPALLTAERAELLNEIKTLEVSGGEPEKLEEAQKKLADIDQILMNLNIHPDLEQESPGEE
jgi:hypothetical protein